MTSLLDAERKKFSERLEKQYAEQKQSSFQKKFWEHFSSLGLPSKKSEVFRYLKMRKLYGGNFSSIAKVVVKKEVFAEKILPDCQKSHLVFVNGRYCSELSSTAALPENFVVLTTDVATKTYGAFLQNSLATRLKRENDPFAALNGAMAQEGVFLYLPPNHQLEVPLQVLHIVDLEAPALLTPKLHLYVGKSSSVQLITETIELSSQHYFSNEMIEMTIEEGANVSLSQIKVGCHPNAWIFDAVRATLKRDSALKTVAITDGAATVRHDYDAVLKGENGEVSLSGLCMLEGEREAHTHVLVEHVAPHCRSMQLFKGVLNAKSRSSFEGKIFVHKEAQKTDAFQLNNNLLLSDQAQANSKPNLEIFADDVKASHGATVGQLQEEQLFYLRARGYKESEAKRLLVQGYCLEVIDQLENEALKARMMEWLNAHDGE